MSEEDQEKTSFITSQGLYYYKVMLFGLKNAVYVDDILIESKEEDTHLDDLKEIFATLRQYQMRLNPSKYTFGVSLGKFIRFMVS